MRDACEAREALRGGADVIDVKEPASGSLGAPRPETVAEVLATVRDARPVTVAAGDLDGDSVERVGDLATPSGVAAIKIGLAGHAGAEWAPRIARIVRGFPPAVELVLTAYADSDAAESPPIEEVLARSTRLGLHWVLIDTWSKSDGDLFSFVAPASLAAVIGAAAESGIAVALAGKLQNDPLRRAARLQPALVGVRSAACRNGRDGRVEADLVKAAAAIASQHRPNRSIPAEPSPPVPTEPDRAQV